MVVSGRVTLSASVNGQPVQEIGMDVRIRSRAWTGQLQYPDTMMIQSQEDRKLPYPPVGRYNDELEDGFLGLFWDPGFDYKIAAGTGPNEGWFFMLEPPRWSAKAEIHINAGLNPRDPFWRAQKGPPPGRVWSSARPPCGPDWMNLARRFVTRHEVEHYNRAKAWYQSAEAATALEAVVKYASVSFGVQFDSTDLRAVHGPLDASQADWDAHNKLRVPCHLQAIDLP
jgi:hypothetical protein